MRKVGVSGIHRKQQQNARFALKTAEIGLSSASSLGLLLANLKTHLETFAKTHPLAITNPAFQTAFSQLCRQTGADPHLQAHSATPPTLLSLVFPQPAASDRHKLAIRIIQVCIESKAQLVPLANLSATLSLPPKPILDALASIACLGIQTVTVDSLVFVKCVSDELNDSYQCILELNPITVDSAARALETRHLAANAPANAAQAMFGVAAERVLNSLVREGVVWLDSQVSPVEYMRIDAVPEAAFARFSDLTIDAVPKAL